jgi:CelD/BcsL family acetyltransferase involved in cellulose biosynthesis
VIVDIVRTPEDLLALREEWNALFAITPEISGFQSHAWLAACWAHDTEDSELHVGVVRAGGRAVAIFPTRRTARGRIAFVGREVSNYAGPVFDPAQLPAAVAAWAAQLRADPQVKAIDLDGLRERSPFSALVRTGGLPGWGAPVSVATHTCSEVDVAQGWKALHERHKSKQRSAWRRKATRLGKLGELQFSETSDPATIVEAIPRMAELFAKRWEGQRVDGFSSQLEFQSTAAAALAADGLALLSTLRLDGEIIAFAYGIRSPTATSSYVLAHDDRFYRFSPGLLLLLQVLEAAAERGDERYDFSVGEAPYKAQWMTGQQDVHRALWGAGRRPRAAWSAAWARARDVEKLRALKLGGPRALLGRDKPAAEPADAPGLPAGAPPATTYVYERTGDGAPALRPGSYADMREAFSPRLLALAIERGFRGDELLAVEGTGGFVWRAAPERRAVLLGETIDPGTRDVYYHPVGAPGVAAALAGLLVSPVALDAAGAPLGEAAADPGTWTTEP